MAVRTITYNNFIAPSEPLLKELKKVKDLFELKIKKIIFKLYHNNLLPYFNSYRSHLEKIVTSYTLHRYFSHKYNIASKKWMEPFTDLLPCLFDHMHSSTPDLTVAHTIRDRVSSLSL